MATECAQEGRRREESEVMLMLNGAVAQGLRERERDSVRVQSVCI